MPLLCVCVCVCPPLRDMKCNYICPWEHFNRSVSASGKLLFSSITHILQKILRWVCECVFVLLLLQQFKGALCRFGEDIWVRRERSLLTVRQKLSLFSSLNEQTDLKEVSLCFGSFCYSFLGFCCIFVHSSMPKVLSHRKHCSFTAWFGVKHLLLYLNICHKIYTLYSVNRSTVAIAVAVLF